MQISRKRLVNILLHVLFTTIIVLVPIFLMPLKEAAPGGGYNFYNLPSIVLTALATIACYSSAYILYPYFLMRKRITAYLCITIATCLFIAGLSGYLSSVLLPEPPSFLWAHIIVKFFIVLFVMGTGTAYRFVMEVFKLEHKQKESMTMELSFLRSQVSPHFMFNTLNSLVALARKKSDKLEPALMELSNLMHYMLYESDQEKVCLSKEIDYIQSYIDLQTLRFGHNVKIMFTVHKPQPADPSIEPMLLIPLIENAFKHGIGMIHEPEIDIRLLVDQRELHLSVHNKYNDAVHDTRDKTSGIGLVNLERRLRILYPQKHTMSLRKEGVYFNASLKLQLHDSLFGC
ncbi:histidine kinase [Paraflavitalea sp. CAU 1676]|uniref:sensor histidine kinase n=1 Tax=Paraflavitalea sp. CAU 1676 TaxID=3032598 RepID=UPI0023DA9863|nr:histidine kinase [Paraflavitalea sp. CAU 1676]MDF2188971.1 histidine kinase [Paraflavitalea sp. CAU 1676]